MATLTNGIVSLTGITTKAGRTVCDEQVTYKPRGKYWDSEDVNQVVYDLMIIAAYDMVAVGQVVYGGTYTAAEMAGAIGYLHQYMNGEDYLIVKIETKTFCCTYHAGEAFSQIAEWEGVMNLSPKKQHRFTVEGKDVPKGAQMKPYQRCHGYKPKTISLAAENARIAKKFEVLGAMARSLTSEGMRRALTVRAAVRKFYDMGYDIKDMASKALDWKLWKDYGREPGSQPIEFGTKDFDDAPEIWKQVDREYMQELVAHFKQMLADSPKPEWPKANDLVMLKGREKMAKKYQGKFLCESLHPRLSTYGDRIEWSVSVRTKKWDCEYFAPGQLEPAPDDPKKAKKQARPKAKTMSKPAAKPQTSNISPKTSLSMAERLREALLRQFAKAA